jgi:hypothetical protein
MDINRFTQKAQEAISSGQTRARGGPHCRRSAQNSDYGAAGKSRSLTTEWPGPAANVSQIGNQ